jgi:lantibiotic modifying enzyme
VTAIVQHLVDIVQANTLAINALGLYNGLAGDLLFLWHASEYDGINVDEDQFNEKLAFLQNHIFDTAAHVGLSYGLAGTGWLLEYLNQAQGEDYDPELCEDIDTAIDAALNVSAWENEVELVLGLSGLAVYIARRAKHSDQTSLYTKLVAHLEALATRPQPCQISWPQPSGSVYRFDKDDRNSTEYNLGLAHGVPGIIAILVPALENPFLHDRVADLLRQSCDWLLEQQLKDCTRSFYSTKAGIEVPSRLGWCYGDLTIALTLARVGNALQLGRYVDKAKEITLHACKRDAVAGSIRDAGLCHGASGLALIFGMLADELALEECRNASNRWHDYTVSAYRQGGIKAFYSFRGDTGSYTENAGFLEGYAGIGLCLLGSQGLAPSWTDSLALS